LYMVTMLIVLKYILVCVTLLVTCRLLAGYLVVTLPVTFCVLTLIKLPIDNAYKRIMAVTLHVQISECFQFQHAFPCSGGCSTYCLGCGPSAEDELSRFDGDYRVASARLNLYRMGFVCRPHEAPCPEFPELVVLENRTVLAPTPKFDVSTVHIEVPERRKGRVCTPQSAGRPDGPHLGWVSPLCLSV